MAPGCLWQSSSDVHWNTTFPKHLIPPHILSVWRFCLTGISNNNNNNICVYLFIYFFLPWAMGNTQTENGCQFLGPVRVMCDQSTGAEKTPCHRVVEEARNYIILLRKTCLAHSKWLSNILCCCCCGLDFYLVVHSHRRYQRRRWSK